MTDPEFKVGDAVEFMVCVNGTPIWDHSLEREYAEGPFTVHYAQVLYSSKGKNFIITSLSRGWTWRWPTKGNAEYHPTQWDRPGYLRKVGSASGDTATSEGGCRCDSFNLARFGHEEGCVEKK